MCAHSHTHAHTYANTYALNTEMLLHKKVENLSLTIKKKEKRSTRKHTHTRPQRINISL